MKLLFLLLLLNVKLRILKVKPRKERWESVDSMFTSVKCCPKTSYPVAPGFCLSAKPGPNWQQWPRHCPEGGWLQMHPYSWAAATQMHATKQETPKAWFPPHLGLLQRHGSAHRGPSVGTHSWQDSGQSSHAHTDPLPRMSPPHGWWRWHRYGRLTSPRAPL